MGRNDEWRSVPVDRVRLNGPLGRRIALTATNNPMKIDLEKDFFGPFRNKTLKEGFIGLGKLLDGVAYSGPDRLIVLRKGESGRPLVERRRLPVFIALDGAKKCRVHALDVSGRRVGEVPCAFDKGVLSFTADTKGPDGSGVLAWEIVR